MLFNKQSVGYRFTTEVLIEHSQDLTMETERIIEELLVPNSKFTVVIYKHGIFVITLNI